VGIVSSSEGRKYAVTVGDPIRVLCVDNHPLVCKGVAFILANQDDMQLVGEAHSGRQAVEAFRTLEPDVTLMDLRMPDLDGIEATKRIIGHAPDAKVIALTTYGGDQEIHRAFAAGVRGYILKETLHAEVLQAIRAVHSGKRIIPSAVAERLSEHLPQVALTKREVQILKLVGDGLGNKEIGGVLGNASGTIRMHLQHIFRKLQASDRAHAVTIAIKRGIFYHDDR
jgi:DNA-binding NarL/FixJ family response regulator